MSNTWTQQTPEGREWRRVWGRSWYQKNREKQLARCAARRRNKRAWLLVDGARARAAKAGLPYDLDGYQGELQKRIDAGLCELSGIRLNLDGGRTFDSPSLDRIVPRLGYVRSNVRIVCDLVNRALNDYGEEALFFVMESTLAKRRDSLRRTSND